MMRQWSKRFDPQRQFHTQDTGFGEVSQAFYARFHTKLQAFFSCRFPALPQASRAGAVEIEAGQGGGVSLLMYMVPKANAGLVPCRKTNVCSPGF